MNLTKWRPFDELTAFRRQMDNLFDSFFGKEGNVPVATEQQWSPAVDVAETDNEITVKVEAPGVEEKDLTVNLAGEVLTVKGERKEEKEEKDKHYHRVERSYGSFQRSFTLPATVDADKVKAQYNKGVLEIRLPKKEVVKPKSIPIAIGK